MNRWDEGSEEGNEGVPSFQEDRGKSLVIASEARQSRFMTPRNDKVIPSSRAKHCNLVTWFLAITDKSVLPLLLMIMLMLLAVDAVAGGVDVRDVTLWESDNSYLLDADIDYFPTDKVIEALKNGISLTFEVTVKVRESDSWLGWFGRALAKRKIRFELRYRPLSSLYEISRDDNQMQRNFVSWKSLFSNLGELRQIAIAESGKLDVRKKYHVEIKAELDINSLPLPMRPMAYIDSDWEMSSGWSEWPLHQ